MKLFVSLFFLFSFLNFVKSQDLNATVIINSDRIQISNTTIFNDLQKSISNFLNSTSWTKNTYQSFEKVECTFRFNLISYQNSKEFKANLQIQSRRPIYGTSLYSPIINIQDDKISFNYTENQQILFNDRIFSGNNLSEILAFYVYLILGIDLDTFVYNGGTELFKNANQISQNSTNQGFDGWEQNGSKSRALIIKNILSPNLSELRNIWYEYHKDGLDKMYLDPLTAKTNIYNTLYRFNNFSLNNTNVYNIQDYFLYLKQDEIQQIFSEKLSDQEFDIKKLKLILQKVAPNRKNIWDKLQ